MLTQRFKVFPIFHDRVSENDVVNHIVKDFEEQMKGKPKELCISKLLRKTRQTKRIIKKLRRKPWRDIRNVILIKYFLWKKCFSEAAEFMNIYTKIEGKFDSCSRSGLCILIIERWADKLIFST